MITFAQNKLYSIITPSVSRTGWDALRVWCNAESDSGDPEHNRNSINWLRHNTILNVESDSWAQPLWMSFVIWGRRFFTSPADGQHTPVKQCTLVNIKLPDKVFTAMPLKNRFCFPKEPSSGQFSKIWRTFCGISALYHECIFVNVYDLSSSMFTTGCK